EFIEHFVCGMHLKPSAYLSRSITVRDNYTLRFVGIFCCPSISASHILYLDFKQRFDIIVVFLKKILFIVCQKIIGIRGHALCCWSSELMSLFFCLRTFLLVDISLPHVANCSAFRGSTHPLGRI